MTNAVKAVIVLLALALLVGVCTVGVKVVTGYVDGVRKDAFAAGEAKKDAEYKGRDNEQLAAAHKQIVNLLLTNQALERRLATANRVIEAKIKQESEDAKKREEITLVALDTGALQLRDGIVEIGPCRPGDGTGRAAAIGSAAGGALTSTCARLSKPTERALVALAREADDVVSERNACIEVALSDRRVINGLTSTPPGSTVRSPVQQP